MKPEQSLRSEVSSLSVGLGFDAGLLLFDFQAKNENEAGPGRILRVEPRRRGVAGLAKDEGADPSPVKKADSASGVKRRRADTSPDTRPQIGHALRSVYDQTVDEAIPREMLDLLGRLG